MEKKEKRDLKTYRKS